MKADKARIEDRDAWRAPYLAKLLESRLRAHYEADQAEEERIKGLIDSLVI